MAALHAAQRRVLQDARGLNEFHIALFFHLLGVLGFISGAVLAGAGFELARRRAAPAEVALLLVLARLGAVLLAAGTLLTAGFGLWLVHLGGFGFGTGWVQASIALFALALVLGGFGGQRPKQARLLASQLAAEHAPVSEGLRALLDDPVSRAANYASLLAVLATFALMVFKP